MLYYEYMDALRISFDIAVKKVSAHELAPKLKKNWSKAKRTMKEGLLKL